MQTKMTSRADLHVHSKYSNRPSEWFLRRIGAPESFVEPRALYDACKKAGMDFVTISDHNCISGAQEIAHLPDTFISVEATTYFPENGCKIHCLCSGITEQQFCGIQEVRENIYGLQKYLNEQDIIHTIAHPLFRINDRLTIEQFEKLILMFNRFEGVNGSRNPRACDISQAVLGNLTPTVLNQLADKHGLDPVGFEPWVKTFTGGSDDHGGLYTANAYTITPHAPSVADYLNSLRVGKHEPGGSGGTSIRLANSLYKIAYSYYCEKWLSGRKQDPSIIGAMLRKFSGEAERSDKETSKLKQVITAPIKKVVTKYKRQQLNEVEALIVDEFQRITKERGSSPDLNRDDADTKNFLLACHLSQELSYSFLSKFAEKLSEGKLIGSIQALSSIGPVALGIAPYLTAFSTQHKDEPFLRQVCDQFPQAGALKFKTGKKAWITDTFGDVNGVAHTIKTLSEMAYQNGKPITVVTCMKETPSVEFPLKNFEPVGSFKLPEYELLDMNFPPFMEMLHYFETERFDELIISTPGPAGLAALAIGRLLGLTIKGIYHTDFPQFVEKATEDVALGEGAWKFMYWFYSQMQTIYVPTESYRTKLIDGGLKAECIEVLPRGVNLERFNPAYADEKQWEKYGLNGKFKFLSVGRVAKEKNLDNMLKAFQVFSETQDADLIVVGDGPYRAELEKKYSAANIVFTGFMRGEELARAYASADAFIFPSLTDTFGNAVLEAHASGLPAIVSDQGGPQEIVRSHRSGLIVDATRPEELADAMTKLRTDRELYATLQKNGMQKAIDSRWEIALELL
jgi:glycosyltransferase involved in cell wall biosynthesis